MNATPSPASPKGRRRPLLLAAALMLLLSIGYAAHLVSQELGPWRNEAVALDELYFSACAVRGLDTGYVPSTGCQDNKAPMIFLVHQWLQEGAQPYDMQRVKVAAFVLSGALVLLAALWASWLAGPVAGLVAAALAIQALATDAELLALKTESVGSFFMLLAGLLVVTRRQTTWATWFGAGVLLGLAMMSKQTFAIAGLMLLAWAWVEQGLRQRLMPTRRLLGFSTLMCAGMALPLAAFFLTFWLQGRHDDFLTSVFLYPALYSVPAPDGGPVKTLIWRVAGVLADLSAFPAVVALGCAALALTRHTSQSWDARTSLASMMGFGMLALVVLAPIYFNYHLIPALLLLAVAGGVYVGRLDAVSISAHRGLHASIGVALLALSAIGLSAAWTSNGHRGRDVELAHKKAALSEYRGSHAYSHGGDPSFYVYNGLIPASDVGFTWALPSNRAYWNYAPPPAGSWKARVLNPIHVQNESRLMADFSRTPPRFVAIGHADAAGEPKSGVPQLDQYIRTKCSYQGKLETRRDESMHVYACDLQTKRAPGD